MKTSVKSAVVRHSSALAVALLAFSFSLGSSDAVRAQDPEERRLTLDIELMRGSVDLDGDHDCASAAP